MDCQARKKGAALFAAAFAESLSEVLSEATKAKTDLKVTDDSNLLAGDRALVQYKIQVEGALSGDCFVEFYESQVAALLQNAAGKPADSHSEEQKAFFAKFVSAAVKKLGTTSLNSYGSFTCRLEPVSGLSFGGMFVVPIAAPAGQPEVQVSLYFGAQLLAGLASPFEEGEPNGVNAGPQSAHNLNLVMDVELNVSMRFGKRLLSLREVLELESGSVVELDRLVDEPVELYLDRKLIARGEAVVVDGNYGLRVTEIPQPIASQLLN